jgi:phage terminase large subunit GpA-like protein
MGGVYLTAGIDMQQDRLEVEVVAWGEGEESWSVEYRVLWGDPLAGDVWEDLDDMLASLYEHESGAVLTISAACLDTGGTSGYTQCAYEYLRGKTGRKLFGIKGQAPSFGKPIVAKVQRKQSGKKARKVDLFLVATDEAKLVVMRRLANTTPGTPGYCHIPERDDLAEWCKQVTAEKLVVRYVKGQPVREWHKPEKARNESLDCRVYALAALKIMQPSIKRHTAKLASHPRAAAAFAQLAKQREAEAARAAAPPARALPAPTPAPAPEKPPEAPKRPAAQTKVIRSPAAAKRSRGWVHNWK